MSSNRRVLLCFYAADDIGSPTNFGGVANYFYHPVLRAANLATPAKLEVWSQTADLLPVAQPIAANLYCDAVVLGPELDSFARSGEGIASMHPLWLRVVHRQIDIVVVVASTGFVRACRPDASVSDTCLFKQLVTVSPDGIARSQT